MNHWHLAERQDDEHYEVKHRLGTFAERADTEDAVAELARDFGVDVIATACRCPRRPSVSV